MLVGCAYLMCFVSSGTKRICFGFRVNYLHSGVNWPIAIEFVIENDNPRAGKQTCEHTIFKYRKNYIHQTKKGRKYMRGHISQVGSFDDLSDFRLD